MLRHLFFLTFAFLTFTFSIQTQAQKKPKERKAISLNQVIEITYGSTQWNQESTKIDSATIIFRDANSNKAVLIIVDETAPDSAVFKGKYSIGWTDSEKVVPEIYIPPQALAKEANWYKKFQAQLDKGQLKRKPFITRKSETFRTLDVFDSKEQALAAQKAIADQKKFAEQAEAKPSLQLEKSLKAAGAVLEAEQLALANALALKLAEEAASREADRARLAQLEAQKQEEQKRKQSEMNAAEKKRRKDQATKLAAQALEHFKQNEFPLAEDKFKKSVELDPENISYYYKYGVTLYRNDKFNDSIVILSRCPPGSYDPVERDFYLALNHYRLKENGKALEMFRGVKSAKNPNLSPSAAFYEGLILFGELKYEDAKIPFQEVLDTSADPRLDEQAERYLEQIAGILYFAAQKAKSFLLSGTLGLQNDSNILLVSDSALDQGTATGGGGLRYMFQGSLAWRPIFEKDKEFSTKVSTLYLYSADSDFTSADPTITNISFPYVYKGMLAGLGNKLEVTPAYETLNMNSDGIGWSERLLASTILGINNTTVLDERRFSSVALSIRKDTSPTTTDSSAMKTALSTNQLRFIDKERKKMYNYELGYTINSSQGNDFFYSRYDAKLGYTQPWKWETIWFSQLGLYVANYSRKSPAQTDKNTTLTTGLSKKLNENFTSGGTLAYTMQDSSVDASDYSKWIAMLTLTGNYDF
ncbi:MAG: hypothetical protein SGJ18_05985 [Pseudomonadota bacterium]|nr:hypothetical protein [Pseudomonadota bacterium]